MTALTDKYGSRKNLPGWAPYSCGRWTWVDYYGWTWVGCEPWGWAPYHYGRWYFGPLGWAWWPGPVYSSYFWRPALVGFFGWGAPGFGVGIGFGFGFGHVGWVPLAPFERYRPWYGAAGLRGGAVVANVNVTGLYRNARVANGVSGMNAAEFGRGSVSASNMARASGAELAHAGGVNGRLPMTPSAESRQFTAHSASTQGMPRTSENTRFFSARSTQNGAASSNGGWQRMNGSSNANRAPSQSGGWQRPTGSSQPAAARSSSYSSSQPQVRISPPIVQSRPSSNGASPRPERRLKRRRKSATQWRRQFARRRSALKDRPHKFFLPSCPVDYGLPGDFLAALLNNYIIPVIGSY